MNRHPFCLIIPAPQENYLREAVPKALDLLLLPAATWVTSSAGQMSLTGQAAAKPARTGLKLNCPDVPDLHHVLRSIELNRPGGDLNWTRTVRTRRGGANVIEGQREAFPRLERAGMRLAMCASLDDVLTALRGWGGPIRAVTS